MSIPSHTASVGRTNAWTPSTTERFHGESGWAMATLNLGVVILCVAVFGCTSEKSAVTSSDTKYEAATDSQGASVPDPSTATNALVAERDASSLGNSVDRTNPAGLADNPSGSPSSAGMTPGAAPVDPAAGPAIGGGDSNPEAAIADLPQLAADATFQEASDFFEQANQALRELNGSKAQYMNREQWFDAARVISQAKLDAADRLLAQSSLDEQRKQLALHKRFEALSQLTGLGDIKAAEKLEAFANELTDSKDSVLATDSRIVRLGFAIDKLRNGQTQVGDVMTLLKEFETLENESLSPPVFHQLQQTFSVLTQYGYEDESRQVRDLIATKFADHEEPQIAASAKMLAESARFDEIAALHGQLVKGEKVEAEKFQAAIKSLEQGPADVSLLQFLAGLSLSSENHQRMDVVNLANAAIDRVFAKNPDVELELTAEANAFLDASTQRREIIGKPLNIAYPDLAGASIDWSSYRGSIVVLPFWAVTRPESMQMMLMLDRLPPELADQVKVLGVNLDDTDEELQEFRAAVQLTFPSVRNPDPATRGIRDPLAKQLGIASFPFTAVVDAQGNVSHLIMGSQDKLQTILNELTQPSEKP